MTRWVTLLVFVATAACGNITRKQEDAGVRDDGGVIDAPDAATPMPDAAPPTTSREVLPGGARLTGANYTFDVQVGHPIQQSGMSSTNYKLEGNAAVKP